MLLPPLTLNYQPESRYHSSLICLSIILEPGWTADQLLRDAEGAELLEVRMDKVPDADLRELRHRLPMPFIAAIRRESEGGFFTGSEPERLVCLQRAAEFAPFLDVEFDAFELLQAMGSLPEDLRLICSWHVHNEDMQFFVEDLERFTVCKATIHKLVMPAGMPLWKTYVLVLRLRDMGNVDLTVVHGAGANAACTRILGAASGNLLTYVALNADAATAEGQVTWAEAVELHRLKHIDNDARRLGVIGHPLAHSKSVQLHNRLAAELGLNMVYVRCDVADPEDAEELMTMLDGWSVTLPHKRLAASVANEVNREAQLSGVCNTLVVDEEGGWLGLNTDFTAMVELLRPCAPLESALVYGSGSTARTAIAALRDLGVGSIALAARNTTVRDELIGEFNLESAHPENRYDIVLQCSAAGMFPNDAELSPAADFLTGARVAFDVVYNPRSTAFMHRAEELGVEHLIFGDRMFLLQARAQFRLFTGHEPEMQLIDRIWWEINQ